MIPGKLYRLRNIAEPIRLWDLRDQSGLHENISKNDVLMLVKVEKSYSGCYDIQFLHKNKIGWIMFPHRTIKKIEWVLEEIRLENR